MRWKKEQLDRQKLRFAKRGSLKCFCCDFQQQKRECAFGKFQRSQNPRNVIRCVFLANVYVARYNNNAAESSQPRFLYAPER